MARKVYECFLIIDSNSYARDPSGTAHKMQTLVESAGGKMLASRLWDERRLAYSIKGQRKGVYWLMYFELEGTSVTKFNRACRLTDQIIRFLTVLVEPRLVEKLVAHAKGERAKPTAGGEGESPAPEMGNAAELEDQATVGT